MAQIILFPRPHKNQPKSVTKQIKRSNADRPDGIVDVIGEHSDRVLFEGNVPVKVMNAIIALLGTAGVAVTYLNF
jgi:hypothetical protein